MDLLRRGPVEGDGRIDEQVGSGEVRIHGCGPNGYGTAERVTDDQIPRPRARLDNVPGVGIETVFVRMGAFSMAAKIGRNRCVSRCLKCAGDLPPYRAGRAQSVKEQHARGSRPESMDVQLHEGRHCTFR